MKRIQEVTAEMVQKLRAEGVEVQMQPRCYFKKHYYVKTRDINAYLRTLAPGARV
jgi:hypothetical protein